jgi:hypothetical protein
MHDMDYASKRFDRHESDLRFLSHMLRQSRGKMRLEIMAIIYFLFARIGGLFSWKTVGNDGVSDAS